MAARIGRWAANLAIVAAALFFLVLGAGNHLQLVEARELVEAGTPVEGVVTERISRRKSNSYDFHYRYSVGGREYAALRRSGPYSMRDELAPGSKIRVWHDRAEPSRSTTRAELAELESIPNRLFFPLAGVALLAWAIQRMRRRPQPA